MGGGLRLAHLRGGEDALRETRVAEADLDLNNAVPPDARAHGERQLAEDELEMRDLQPLRRQSDLAVGGEGSRLEMGAEGRLGFGGRYDEDGRLKSGTWGSP